MPRNYICPGWYEHLRAVNELYLSVYQWWSCLSVGDVGLTFTPEWHNVTAGSSLSCKLLLNGVNGNINHLVFIYPIFQTPLFLNAWCLFHFSFLSFPLPFPVVLYHCCLLRAPFSHTNTHNHIISQDQDTQKQTAVVLLSSKGKTCQGSGDVSVTTLCTDVLPASKHAKQRDWLSLLRPSSVSIRSNNSLRFSVSLNDVGQRVDSLCRGLQFIDRTCSEGELELKLEPAQPPDLDRRAHKLNCKLAATPTQQIPNPGFSTRAQPHLVPSFTNNYKYMLGIAPASCLPTDHGVLTAPHSNTHHHPHNSPSSNFLRLLLPFSRSSTSASLQCSDLGSYASHLHIKSSSALLEGSESGLPSEDLVGDDDVFEEDQPSPTSKETGQPASPKLVRVAASVGLLAPVCYMEGDSDLDCCPSPLSEKTGPLSPYSLSGDCCRWVTVWTA